MRILTKTAPTRRPMPSRAGSLLPAVAVTPAGSALPAASAWVRVPMGPVPMTMQGFAVSRPSRCDCSRAPSRAIARSAEEDGRYADHRICS